MSAPENPLFRDLYDATKSMDVKTAQAYFQKQQEKNGDLKKLKFEDFVRYWLHKNAEQRHQERNAEPAKPEQLWAAVSAWVADPLVESAKADPVDILRYLASERFAPVPLGKLDGEYMCRLEPGDAAEPDDDGVVKEKLDYSPSNRRGIRAIKYADGHPSEVHFRMRVRSKDDKILRRFLALGWVHMLIRNRWVKTGHALVIDASRDRKCQPYFVLATVWQTDDEQLIEQHDTEFIKPPSKVKFGDRTALGVLPGHHNRTPIAKLMHYGARHDAPPENFAPHFGEKFKFEFDRMGKAAKSYPLTPHGPDLCEVMNWFWDPKTNEEVCFTKTTGVEYIRYDPKNQTYDGPNVKLEDEVGNIPEAYKKNVSDAIATQSRMTNEPPLPSAHHRGHGHGQGQGHGPWAKGTGTTSGGSSSAY